MPAPASRSLTLRDRLSRLSFAQAAKLLNPNGARRLNAAGRLYDFDLLGNVRLDNQTLRVDFPDATVTISLSPEAVNRLAWRCGTCGGDVPAGDLFDTRVCRHVAAAFSLVLEEKTALGLAKPPPERVPVESLSESDLVAHALAERAERAKTEKMRVVPADPARVWTDYTVTNAASGKTYRVSLRGWERGESYCSCPDFRKNTLGACKHILRVAAYAKRKHDPKRVKPWRPTEIELFLSYADAEPELRLNLPARLPASAEKALTPFRKGKSLDAQAAIRLLGELDAAGTPANVFADAEEYIRQTLLFRRLSSKMAEIRRDPGGHPLRKTLLKAELLPYQLDGIAFAVGAGRAVLADDMGLGKTIQGVGVAEMLAREAGIAKVLVVCPASLKSQWLEEIARFSERTARAITGAADERARQYADPKTFFTVCNYEQVLRDLRHVEAAPWELIILDEAQRVKNWEAATTRVIQGLKSRFALALSGTPLENRLDELYTVVKFVDDRRLGPAFRFFNIHRIADDKGHVLGYKNLQALRERLKPVLLRRTRESVAQQLPARQTEIVRVEPSAEQLEIHKAHLRIVTQIVGKPFFSEMDLLRLRKALLMCRLAANSTELVDKKPPGFSTKLERLDELLGRLLAERGRKIVLFSEWTSMLDLIEPLLAKHEAGFVRLDGSVPQTKRQALVNRFKKDADCPVFLSTNAGSTGLNLQAANTVVNVDLPWNPAVLEQRIARAHRMGQKRPVQAYLLVTEDTLEERLLGTLDAKRDLALAALDPESAVDLVAVASGVEALKGRLEVLLGRPADAPIDLSACSTETAEKQERRERLESAGGQLLSAAVSFLGELLPKPTAQSGAVAQAPAAKPECGAISGDALAARLRDALSDCLHTDDAGRHRLSITLPDTKILDTLAEALAGLLATRGS